MKQLLVAVMFTALITSPAFAKSHHARVASAVVAPDGASTVVVDGTVVGRDPDAAIRTQLFRACPYGPT
jgi:hypothetical protein